MHRRKAQGIVQMRYGLVRLMWLLLVAVSGAPLSARGRVSGGAADSTAAPSAPAGMDHSAMHHGMDMGLESHGHAMRGVYGPYPMTREASGTAWQPDAARHAGVHV